MRLLERVLDVDFVITVDRSMMSNHHGKEFLGFMTTGPPILFPERIWMWIAAPKPEVDRYGRPRYAPYGLRKIEAALLDAGYRAAIIDPDHLEPYLARARAVLIGHHDYFAFNPPSSEWWLVTGMEPVNRRSFLRLARRIARVKRERNPGLRVIVGGPAAWQWLYTPHYVREFLVDTIVEGEAEKVVVEIAEAVMRGEELPRYISVAPADAPSVDEIPVIKGASVNGLVEVMRGCPRGCRFCSVTLRRLRHIPLPRIEEELRVNREAGIRDGVIHSEDVLLYGSDTIIPNPEALEKLHRLVKKYYETIAWSHIALATLVAGQERYRVATRLAEIVMDEHQDYIGVQTGIETGSPRLAEKTMPAKAAPYPPAKWPEVVEQAFSIMHEHHIVPAATIILGLPGETREDVVKTIELVERLKPYRSLIVPMFFVPLGALRSRDWFRTVNITYEHAELLIATLRHSAYWAKDILERFYIRRRRHAPLRLLLSRFIDKALEYAYTLTPEKLLDYIEQARERLEKGGEQEEWNPLTTPLRSLRRLIPAHT